MEVFLPGCSLSPVWLFFLLSVCLGDTFGQDCSLRCEDCLHGGRCNSERSGCVCPPGWAGITCNQSEYRGLGGGNEPPAGTLHPGKGTHLWCFSSVKLPKEHSCLIIRFVVWERIK